MDLPFDMAITLLGLYIKNPKELTGLRSRKTVFSNNEDDDENNN